MAGFIYSANRLWITNNRFIQVLLSFIILMIGCFIYVIYREDTLIMFKCFDKLGISNTIQHMRIIGTEHSLYDWVRNCLPDGLWLFSYMFLIETIWNGEKTFYYNFFLWLLPIIALLSEILQAFSIVPGYYDNRDIICYLSAIVVFLILKFIIK